MTWYGMAWQDGMQSLGTLFRVSIRLMLTSTLSGFSGGLQNFVWHYRKIDRSVPPQGQDCERNEWRTVERRLVIMRCGDIAPQTCEIFFIVFFCSFLTSSTFSLLFYVLLSPFFFSLVNTSAPTTHTSVQYTLAPWDICWQHFVPYPSEVNKKEEIP